jgi:catechol 2,3-dioxygenase-like lactoylglutathione lyase family enzyme
MQWQPLVPELVVADFDSSLRFYTSILGFEVKYRRANPSFAYLEFERSQLMIEELQDDSWLLGALERPFGRGMNLQIQCTDVMSLRKRLAAAGIDVYREIEDAWYETDAAPVGQRQFLVADPDGYLLRFCQVLGAR